MRRFVILLSFLVAVCARAEDTQIRWSGRVALDAPLTVTADQILVVEPGTEIAAGPGGTVLVQGKAYLLGTAESPVRITGTREAPQPVFQANTPEAVVRLHRVEAEGCGTVVGATAGTVVATESAFRKNATALRLQMRTRAVLGDVAFEENDLGLAADNGALVTVDGAAFRKNTVGVGAGNSVRLTLRGCRFEANETGYSQTNGADTALEGCSFTGHTGAAVFLRQSRRSPRISFCRFEENRAAVVARSTSHPLVEASAFRGNRVAFDAKEFCGPLLRFNAFEGNAEAVRLDHKSGAKIRGNRFERNGTALFLDFSSYPEVRRNRFADNDWHVKLGRFMSADWERRQGSARITLGKARERNTRNPMMLRGTLPGAAGVVDVSENDWDEETRSEMEAGPEANLSRIWDGRDEPKVAYTNWGTGQEKFTLDRVRFSPPLTASPAVGPEAWIPLDTELPTKPIKRGPGAPPAPPARPSHGEP
ncbi:right-handed parallel beta-helix repeat-containing protein [Deferrisoma camini]|uniref:right-handed parallel beta-helix repeat-containing protein n=1 Tax=Deferrisoma camini TaxID=1035120 RepID=UPI00046D4E6E|nr:right-handed parallel beta-helix repeat-containing protein [Deferrisoma camini]